MTTQTTTDDRRTDLDAIRAALYHEMAEQTDYHDLTGGAQYNRSRQRSRAWNAINRVLRATDLDGEAEDQLVHEVGEALGHGGVLHGRDTTYCQEFDRLAEEFKARALA